MRKARSASPYLDDGIRLGAVIRSRRTALGRSREDIARRARISTETVTKIERGETVEPGVFTARALATAVDLRLDQLLDEVDRAPLPITPVRLTAAAGLLSIGYEGRTLDELITALTERHVNCLIDVRLNPISRKPGLSKRALSAALNDAGIRYEHLPALGNPKENRAGFAERAGHEHRLAYQASLLRPDAKASLNEIASTSRSGLTAILCFERDEALCHRQLIIDALQAAYPDLVRQRA